MKSGDTPILLGRCAPQQSNTACRSSKAVFFIEWYQLWQAVQFKVRYAAQLFMRLHQIDQPSTYATTSFAFLYDNVEDHCLEGKVC